MPAWEGRDWPARGARGRAGGRAGGRRWRVAARCGGWRRVAAGGACLRASSTAPALSGPLAVRGAAGEGGTEAIDSCSAEAVTRSVSELAEPEGSQLSGPPCCMVTHDHLLAASVSETPQAETPPATVLLGVERLASGSAVAGLGSAGCREGRSSVRRDRRAVGQGALWGKARHAATHAAAAHWRYRRKGGAGGTGSRHALDVG